MIEIRNSATLERLSEDGWITIGGEVIGVIEADSLVGADLRNRKLPHADFSGADLRSADFTGARLSCAQFRDADLSAANLEGAYIRMGDFRGACLSATNLTNAGLVGAFLQGVDLRKANLHHTDLRFAHYDETTQWPDDIDPQARCRVTFSDSPWRL